jgi:hypothetical protein
LREKGRAAVGREACWSCREWHGLLLRTRAWALERESACGCWSGCMLELSRMAWPSSAHKSVGACARKGVRLLVGKHVGAVANGMAFFCEQENECLSVKKA